MSIPAVLSHAPVPLFLSRMSREPPHMHVFLHRQLLAIEVRTLSNTIPTPSPSLHNYAITHTQPPKHIFTWKKKKKTYLECEAKSLGLTSMWPLMYEAFGIPIDPFRSLKRVRWMATLYLHAMHTAILPQLYGLTNPCGLANPSARCISLPKMHTYFLTCEGNRTSLLRQ